MHRRRGEAGRNPARITASATVPGMTAPLIIITGSPGAGKSTAAELVADHSDPSAVVSGDAFFDFLRRGRIRPWLPESDAQNRVVMAATIRAAVTYSIGGLTTVLDGIVGPWFMDLVLGGVPTDVPLHYVVLSAELETTRQRVAGDADPEQAKVRLDAAEAMHAKFANLGPLESHRIDTTTITPDDAKAQIVAGLESGAFLINR